MLVFIIGISSLALGYLVYGGWLQKAVRPDARRPMPSVTNADGVDYIDLPTWRVYLVQLLNIAGLGPVFGPIMGALWGPSVFLWVVLGSVLGGAVHDFLSGVMSVRAQGAGLPDLIGLHLGNTARHFAAGFILLLMVLVGTVFVKAPAELMAGLLPAKTLVDWMYTDSADGVDYEKLERIWLVIIMAGIYIYYLVATLLPVDKIIGRIYPLFAVALLVMVIGLGLHTLFDDLQAPEFNLSNPHPLQIPAWPVMFITVSCGAISGFHATQSPMMARCLKTEGHMRLVFYGAMITEALIALIWASVSQGYYQDAASLSSALKSIGPAGVVHTICTDTMGFWGGILAILGVVVLPITSGDTAFRVARLTVSDYLKLDQKRVLNRYRIAFPMFGLSVLLQFVSFGIIWRYFGWANQALAAITLWTGSVYLAKQGRYWLFAAVPAVFMTVMTVTFILSFDQGFGLDLTTATLAGCLCAAVAAIFFIRRLSKFRTP